MNKTLSLMEIEQYQARIPILGAKTVLFCQCFSLQDSDSLIVIEGGLTSSDQRTLLDNMLKSCHHTILSEQDSQQWQQAQHILWLGSEIPEQLMKNDYKVELCPHPQQLLAGDLKSQAYKILLNFFQ